MRTANQPFLAGSATGVMNSKRGGTDNEARLSFRGRQESRRVSTVAPHVNSGRRTSTRAGTATTPYKGRNRSIVGVTPRSDLPPAGAERGATPATTVRVVPVQAKITSKSQPSRVGGAITGERMSVKDIQRDVMRISSAIKFDAGTRTAPRRPLSGNSSVQEERRQRSKRVLGMGWVHTYVRPFSMSHLCVWLWC